MPVTSDVIKNYKFTVFIRNQYNSFSYGSIVIFYVTENGI